MLVGSKGAYTLAIIQDENAGNPRIDHDNLGTMTCFHRRYDLGDPHKYENSDDFLHDLYLKSTDGSEEKYDRLLDRISRQPVTPYGSYEYARAVNDALLKEIGQKYIVLPLYLYDHSGLAISTRSFLGRAQHAEWDSGQVGLVYVSKEDALKEFDGKIVIPAIREKAENLLRAEVDTYDSYLRGECYGYELYKDGVIEDSCWGFLGDLNAVRSDMEEYLPEACKGITEHLTEQDDRVSMARIFLKHAQIQADQAARALEQQPRSRSRQTELR